ncbi:hypothetical protein Poli38472_003473 [Pythium oligandrum]|uniref:Apple domain-containing protein n=1 Tax=Pythium oligandrum TaxID=41045 RepID=A0A8K1C790_PYTOL|nr:hypothetical protein Poli38472_003473 [Pythium oligandrum]|eukprot:TMW57548.1 hypothetical protein Poli38472_003473 [Pythium oligandrum]
MLQRVAVLLGILAVSSASAATDCVTLGSLAETWDAVTLCNDWYGVLVNSDARVRADEAASVKTSTKTESLGSVEECALNCLNKKKCQWFSAAAASNGNKTCTYYQHLSLKDGSKTEASNATTGTTQFGFVLGGDSEYLNQNVANNSNSSVFQLGDASFYRTTDVTNSKTISMYLPQATATCAASPLTLYRAFAINYQTASMLAKVKSGETINSMDATFTLDNFLKALKAGTLHEISVPTDAVDIDSTGKVVRTGLPGSTYSYHLDNFGRPTEVKARMNFTNVLRKPGRPGQSSTGATIRAQYCVPAYQQRYNVIQELTDATKGKMPFQAGHLAGCQFSNPNGFFNFVPQSAKSNSGNGCWYNTELSTAQLLKMGCEGDFHIRLSYFSKPGDISEISSFTGALLTQKDAENFYTLAGNDPKLLVQKPCGFFYRPVKMSIDFTVTGWTPDTQCAAVGDVLLKNEGRLFATSANDASMTISRAFAHWMYDAPAFNHIRGMATADWRTNQCYAETGSLLSKMTFTNELDSAFLKLKVNATNSTATPSCVSAGKTLEVSACKAGEDAFRWSSASLQLKNNATDCVSLSSDPQRCMTLAFEYTTPSITFNGTMASITTADELVDGHLVVKDSSECLAVSKDAKISLTTKTTDCSVFQATYSLVASTADDDGGDD